MIYLLGALSAFLIATLLIPFIRKFAIKVGAVDNPKEADRKIHKKVMARGGGIGIYIAFVVVCFALLDVFSKEFVGLIVAGTMVLVVGLIDDIKRLSPWIKLIVQISAAMIASIGFGITIANITNPFGGTIVLENITTQINIFGQSFGFNWIAVALAVLWMVGMTNTINFLDGIDGLSGGVSAIAAGIIFLLAISDKVSQPNTALVSIVLMGAALGFLVYNFYPAKIFNGDSGAYFLGMTLGILAIFSGAKLATAALVLGLPILDAVWAVLRRLIHKKSPFTADRGHLHYLFLDAGFSQRQAVLSIYLLCIIFGLIGIMGTTFQKAVGILVLVIVMAVLLIGLAMLKKRKANKSN